MLGSMKFSIKVVKAVFVVNVLEFVLEMTCSWLCKHKTL